MTPAQGTIVAWKSDKAFGFIRPLAGGADVFVHLRDFGNIQRPPAVGDSVTYQPMKDKDGRYRAADVRIAGAPRIPRARRAPRTQSPPPNKKPRRESVRASPIEKIGFIAAISLAAYVIYNLLPSVPHTATPEPVRQQQLAADASFSCTGKRYCSEMHSCEEATYYLNSCPNTEMDGDNDGVPCENQWCR